MSDAPDEAAALAARVRELADALATANEALASERAARAESDRLHRWKDEFLATFSHELRTPLSAILSWAKVLLIKRDDAASLERGLNAIARSATAQARLIDDLLDTNRIVAGTLRIDMQPTDLGAIVEAAVTAARPAAEAKAIRLHSALDPRAGLVAGDARRLQQVVSNLLDNAVKFTPRDGTIEVMLQGVGAHLEITVGDDGIGIETHFLPQVFDRLCLADPSTAKSPYGGLGLGLGLSIARRLVELHGGSMRASSDGPGRGATFVVALPLASAPLPDHDAAGF